MPGSVASVAHCILYNFYTAKVYVQICTEKKTLILFVDNVQYRLNSDENN